MRGMRRDVGASLSGPCNPTSCKSPTMNREQSANTEQQQNTTINTAHSKFYVVRREAYVHGRSRESIFIGKGRKGLHAQDLSSLFARKEKVTRDAIENWRPEI